MVEPLQHHPEYVIAYRLGIDADHGTIIRAPRFSCSMDKLPALAEFYDSIEKAADRVPGL